MNIIAAQIKGDITHRKKRIKDVCEEMKMSPATWSRRMDDPGTFTVTELRILHKYLSDQTMGLMIPERRKT